MKFLVSGSTGFIGNELCRYLSARTESLVALSRSDTVLAGGTATCAVDLRNAELDERLLGGVDVVCHLAGIAHQQAESNDYYELNYRSTLRLARQAAAQGVKCFIYLSSVKARAFDSTGDERTEGRVTVPDDVYGLSKWQAECDLRDEFSGSPMSIVILRPALVYGVGVKGNLRSLSRAVKIGLPRPPALGRRSMVSLQDLVELIYFVSYHHSPGVQTWVVSDGESYSFQRLYDAIRLALGREKTEACLPLWAWRSAGAVLDRLQCRAGAEKTFEKLFGTELYSNADLSRAYDWRPRLRFEDVVADMVTQC